MIKKIRFKIEPVSYGNMGHLEFFNDDTALKVDLNAKTLTLSSGEIINITVTASSEYGGYAAINCFNTTGAPAHDYTCWCSATGSGECWLEIEFEPAIPKHFANKMTFCCGEDHGSYPSTFTLFFIDEKGKSEQIGQPLYVDAHNGIFEWVNLVRCFVGKDGLYYFLRPEVKI